MDWDYFVGEFGPLYVENKGRPGKPVRLLVALHYLKHTYNQSDESVVERFLENPYWQYFCGFEYFQHEFPLDPTRFSEVAQPDRFRGHGEALLPDLEDGSKSRASLE